MEAGPLGQGPGARSRRATPNAEQPRIRFGGAPRQQAGNPSAIASPSASALPFLPTLAPSFHTGRRLRRFFVKKVRARHPAHSPPPYTPARAAPTSTGSCAGNQRRRLDSDCTSARGSNRYGTASTIASTSPGPSTAASICFTCFRSKRHSAAVTPGTGSKRLRQSRDVEKQAGLWPLTCLTARQDWATSSGLHTHPPRRQAMHLWGARDYRPRPQQRINERGGRQDREGGRTGRREGGTRTDTEEVQGRGQGQESRSHTRRKKRHLLTGLSS